MQSAPLPACEAQRLHALETSGALCAATVLGLDRIAATAASQTGAPIACVSFVGADRQWIKASVGLEITETDRDSAFCAWAVYSADVLWVEDALQDPRFADNPLVEGEPHIRHYAGAPILTPEGYVLGTVCIIDHEPRAFDPRVEPVLTRLAGEVSAVLQQAASAKIKSHEHA